jgi:hypothetical protein
MSRKVMSFLMIALVMFASTAALMPQAAAQAGGSTTRNGLSIPISQAVTGGTGALAPAASIVGTLTITGFQVVNGALAAVGTATVNILDAAGNVLSTVTVANVIAPLTATGSCTILTLDIGAIHLDLLGLVVDLAPIHLNITAQSGPGNLLGNLLCSIANLLNSGGPLSQIANLLNQLLGAL